MMIDLSELVLLVLCLGVEYILIYQTVEALRVWFFDDFFAQSDRYKDARRNVTGWLFLTVVWTGGVLIDLMTSTIIS